MGVTTRLFVADDEKGWRRLALNSGYLASHGALPLPEFAGQTITVAFAHVEVQGPRVLKLLRVDRARWRFDAAGHFDRVFAEIQATHKYWPRSVSDVQDARPFHEGEIASIRQRLDIGGAALTCDNQQHE